MRNIFCLLAGVLIMASGLSAKVVELKSVLPDYELLPLTVKNWNELPGVTPIDSKYGDLKFEGEEFDESEIADHFKIVKTPAIIIENEIGLDGNPKLDPDKEPIKVPKNVSYLLKLRDPKFTSFLIDANAFEKVASEKGTDGRTFNIVKFRDAEVNRNEISSSWDIMWNPAAAGSTLGMGFAIKLNPAMGKDSKADDVMKDYAQKLLALPEPEPGKTSTATTGASSADATGALEELANQLTVLGSK